MPIRNLVGQCVYFGHLPFDLWNCSTLTYLLSM